MPKQLPRDKIAQTAVASSVLSERDKKIISLTSAFEGKSADNENPYVALKYFRESFECFSAWNKEELKAFSDFLAYLAKMTWQQVLRTSGKTEKSGLAYTAYDTESRPDAVRGHFKEVRKLIGDDISFFELRVNQKIRVHGFRSKAIFFLVLLDREHRVFPE